MGLNPFLISSPCFSSLHFVLLCSPNGFWKGNMNVELALIPLALTCGCFVFCIWFITRLPKTQHFLQITQRPIHIFWFHQYLLLHLYFNPIFPLSTNTDMPDVKGGAGSKFCLPSLFLPLIIVSGRGCCVNLWKEEGNRHPFTACRSELVQSIGEKKQSVWRWSLLFLTTFFLIVMK